MKDLIRQDIQDKARFRQKKTNPVNPVRKMTRRKFIQKLITTGAAIITGTWWLAKKAAPRKFVRAIRLKKYPGSLFATGELRNVCKQSKWSG